MNNKINKLRNFINNKCIIGDIKSRKRKRKLHFKDILYFLFSSVTNGTSYALTNSMMKIKKIVNVSKQAISSKRKIIDYKLIEYMCDELINHINNSNILIKANIYAIDGSKLSFSKELSKEGFKLTKNNTYCKGLLSCLYDVVNKIPIKTVITKYFNERNVIINNLINYIPKNSILLLDRGYYSDELINILNEKNIKFIIRMKKNSLNVKYMEENKLNDKLFFNKHQIIRYVKYKINNNSYYISTNIFIRSVKYLKDLYHSRWSIEEYYKTIKHTLTTNDYKTTTFNKINQELYAQVILTILARYLEILSVKFYKEKKVNTRNNNKNNGEYKINHKNTIYIVGNSIIYNLLYKKRNKKIINCLLIIKEEIIYVILNRICPKIRIRPTSKWYYVGLINKLKNT